MTHLPLRRVWRRFLRSGSGNAAIEFGVAAPILATLIAGTADLGLMANRKATLDAAVRAGAQYARIDPTNTGAITSVVTSYANFSPTVTVTVPSPAPFCECDDGTSVDCTSGTCASGSLHSYVTVQATQPYSAIIPLGVLTATSITSTLTTRIQ